MTSELPQSSVLSELFPFRVIYLTANYRIVRALGRAASAHSEACEYNAHEQFGAQIIRASGGKTRINNKATVAAADACPRE